MWAAGASSSNKFCAYDPAKSLIYRALRDFCFSLATSWLHVGIIRFCRGYVPAVGAGMADLQRAGGVCGAGDGGGGEEVSEGVTEYRRLD